MKRGGRKDFFKKGNMGGPKKGEIKSLFNNQRVRIIASEEGMEKRGKQGGKFGDDYPTWAVKSCKK